MGFSWAMTQYTDKKVKSKRKGFLIYEEMRKYFSIYGEAVSHI
jgi:hypothetical protein